MRKPTLSKLRDLILDPRADPLTVGLELAALSEDDIRRMGFGSLTGSPEHAVAGVDRSASPFGSGTPTAFPPALRVQRSRSEPTEYTLSVTGDVAYTRWPLFPPVDDHR